MSRESNQIVRSEPVCERVSPFPCAFANRAIVWVIENLSEFLCAQAGLLREGREILGLIRKGCEGFAHGNEPIRLLGCPAVSILGALQLNHKFGRCLGVPTEGTEQPLRPLLPRTTF